MDQSLAKKKWQNKSLHPTVNRPRLHRVFTEITSFSLRPYHTSGWPKAVQKMAKKGEVKPRLSELYSTTVAQLNPPRSGLLFALAHFMCHDPENTKKHHVYMNKLREGGEPSVELIVESYGYRSESAFNKAFTEYVLSRKFR